MRREEMEEQFNEESKQGWRLAADAARITDESAGSEVRKHTSGGAFVASDISLGAVIDRKKKKMNERSRPSQEMREEPSKMGKGQRRCTVQCWDSRGWTPRSEALMEAAVMQARTAMHPWLVVRDANMAPEDYKKSL